MKKIILTGGGTAGHVTPNLALVPGLKAMGYDILYIGSYNGIEKNLVESENIHYYGISSGKLRRYFDFKNFTDPFRVIKGYFEAKKMIQNYKPDIIFSKGGFVTVPVVYAAKTCKVPVILHESDITPGLANKLAFSRANTICYSFPETLQHLPKNKAVFTGSPIRIELSKGNPEKARNKLGFHSSLPVLLIIGGSLGSVKINTAIRSILSKLLSHFQIIHLCGKGNIDSSLLDIEGYQQFEYVNEELKDYFALSDIILSRAGANVIFEILSLKKPHILIPLSFGASRGDQILNAKSFEQRGFSYVLNEEDLNEESLYKAIFHTYAKRDEFIVNMEESTKFSGVDRIITLIQKYSS